MSDLLTTPLTQWHKDHGAKMAPFAGWDMPIQYAGIIAEHQHTRTKASIFDICHMGEFSLRGKGAANALSEAVTQDLSTLKPGRCRYGFLLNENGTVIDDLIVYCHSDEQYMLVVNGARTHIDFETLKNRLPADLDFEDISSATAKIDLQGPESLTALTNVMPGQGFADLPYFGFKTAQFHKTPILVSRTGYTGELGFELYMPWEHALSVWTALLQDPLVKPAGLGARDTLRLEVGLSLYGHELDGRHTPTEAGLGGMLKSQSMYVGKAHAHEVREELIPLAFESRRSARNQDKVFYQGEEVGYVTSGSFAPSLGYAVALAYVKKEVAQNTNFTVKGVAAELAATRVPLPFYKKGTARISIKDALKS